MIAVAQCEDGLWLVEVGETVEDDDFVGREPGGTVERARPTELAPEFVSALLRDVDASGPSVAVLVARRPPLLISLDGGITRAERGSGLPPGQSLAYGPTPDDLLYGARNRLYVSRDGGTFWRALGVELPEILDVAGG